MQGYCINRIVKLIKRSNKRKAEDKNYKAQYFKKVLKQDQKIIGSKLLGKNHKLLRK